MPVSYNTVPLATSATQLDDGAGNVVSASDADDAYDHSVGTGSPHTPAGVGSDAAGTAAAGDAAHLGAFTHGDIATNTAARHTQGTDQALDTGGANEITAINAKAAYTHSTGTGSPHTAVGVGADPTGTAAAGDAAHLGAFTHGDIATNTAARHTRSHALDGSSDHSVGAGTIYQRLGITPAGAVGFNEPFGVVRALHDLSIDWGTDYDFHAAGHGSSSEGWTYTESSVNNPACNLSSGTLTCTATGTGAAAGNCNIRKTYSSDVPLALWPQVGCLFHVTMQAPVGGPGTSDNYFMVELLDSTLNRYLRVQYYYDSTSTQKHKLQTAFPGATGDVTSKNWAGSFWCMFKNDGHASYLFNDIDTPGALEPEGRLAVTTAKTDGVVWSSPTDTSLTVRVGLSFGNGATSTMSVAVDEIYVMLF